MKDGPIRILDKNGTDTGDTALFWEMSQYVSPRHGVDLNFSGKKIQISVTRARKKVHVVRLGTEEDWQEEIDSFRDVVVD